MDWKPLGLVIGAALLGELGDETRLVTRLFAADDDVGKWLVFVGAPAALIATSALGVLGACGT